MAAGGNSGDGAVKGGAGAGKESQEGNAAG